jgi:hypothetical protein
LSHDPAEAQENNLSIAFDVAGISAGYSYRGLYLRGSRLDKNPIYMHMLEFSIVSVESDVDESRGAVGILVGLLNQPEQLQMKPYGMLSDDNGMLARLDSGPQIASVSLIAKGMFFIGENEASFQSKYFSPRVEVGYLFPRFVIEEGALNSFQSSTDWVSGWCLLLNMALKLYAVEL